MMINGPLVLLLVVDPAQKVIGRDMLVEAEVVEELCRS
jgi:hypothetical protein